MPLGLFPRETQDLLSGGLDTGTTPPPQPGLFAGALDSTVAGVGHGLESLSYALTSPSKYANIGPPRMFPSSVQPDQYTEAVKAAGKISDEEYATQLANETTVALKAFQPDPHVVGAAGQTLFGLSSGLTRILAGSAVAGPIGGAVAVGGTEGIATTRELTSHGVDANTAQALGAGAALFSGAGALLPGGVGKTLLERVTTGAYAQFGLGMLNRGLMHNVLDEAGYPEMARAYQPLDGAAMMSDIVLGMGFGAVHHAFAPKPSDLDAAHAIKDAQHVEDAAGGPAADPVSRTNLIDNQTAAAEKIVSGRETPAESADVRVVPDPAEEAAREATVRGVDEAAAEAGAERVDVPVEPQMPLTWFHGTMEATKQKILSTGQFLLSPKTRVYDYSEFGPHAMYFTGRSDTWINPEWSANARAVPYEAHVAAQLARDANIVRIHSDADVEALARRMGLADGKELMDRMFVDMLKDKGKESTVRAKRQGELTKRMQAEGIDGVYVSDKYKGDLISGGEQLALFSHEKMKPIVPGKESVPPPKAEGEFAAPVLDPVTQEAVGQADEILSRLGDLKIENDAGETISASDALRRALDDIKQAQGDGELHRVAAACFGRG